MANQNSVDNACASLKAALKACIAGDRVEVEREFKCFLRLLKEHKLNNVSAPEIIEARPLAPEPKYPDAAIEFEYKPFIDPTEAIPLDLIALATCLYKHGLSIYADTSIREVIETISQDGRLAFLRQNIFQEVAAHLTRAGRYAEAEELLCKQLTIVEAKGSKVLLDFVKINMFINKGNLQLTKSQFEEARDSFLKALLLIETAPEKHPAQVSLLHESWGKLDSAKIRQTS
jgi:tetratricopeptide (TPR) repeat protein